jgi:hypothetical protein
MVTVASSTDAIDLGMDELREVAGYAARCAEDVLSIFEHANPSDARPREATGAAWAFANGAKRTNLQRATAFAAHKAAKEAMTEAAREAARSAGHAAAAAYLHPLARSTQVKHILGAAAHAARAAELAAGGDPAVGGQHIEHAVRHATPAVIEVLSRYPPAPPGGGRVGELLRQLDRALRRPPRERPES